jgi:hypothetical protein
VALNGASLSSFSAQLNRFDSSAFVWALLHAEDGGWVVHHAEVLIAPRPPPGWVEQAWHYERLIFVACAVPA